MCQTENNTYYVCNNFFDEYSKLAIIFWTYYIDRWKDNICMITRGEQCYLEFNGIVNPVKDRK